MPQGSRALFGRNWLRYITLDWHKLPGIETPLSFTATNECSEISHKRTLESLLSEYDELFQPKLGCYMGDPVVLNESKGAKFYKARPVPYALQKRLKMLY